MNNLIKVNNPNVLGKLKALGFSYITTEKINNKDVYIYEGTPDLIRHLQSKFESKDFFIENKLRF